MFLNTMDRPKAPIVSMWIHLGLSAMICVVVGLGDPSTSWYSKQNITLQSCGLGTRYNLSRTECAVICSRTNCSGFMLEAEGSSGYHSNNNNNNNSCIICPTSVNTSLVPNTPGMLQYLRFAALYPPMVSGDEVDIDGGLYPGRFVSVSASPTGDTFRIDFLYTAADSIALRIVHEFNEASDDMLHLRPQCDGQWLSGYQLFGEFLQLDKQFQFLFFFRQTSIMVYLDDTFLLEYPYTCGYDISDIRSFSIKHSMNLHQLRMT